MKTAKEWAESVVSDPVLLDQRMWNVSLIDDQAPPGISLIEPSDEEDAHDLCSDARSIIERLVERVQADTRTPLEDEIARLKEEAWHRERLIAAWIGVLGGIQTRLRGALASNDLVAEVRRIIRDIEAQLTL